MQTIPVIHCFNHNYVLPAAVCFHSLLRHASPERRYTLHVIGTGLTQADRDLLNRAVSKFPNATLDIVEPPPLDGIPEFSAKSNFSKDLFYKLQLADLFPQYDVAVVSDVDVVYAGDIAEAYDLLSGEDPAYLCGPLDVAYAAMHGSGILRDAGPLKSVRRYERQFSAEERALLNIGAGLMTFNLRRMREDRIAEKCMAFVKANFGRLVLPEQDVLNLVCVGRTKPYPPHLMAIAGYEEQYRAMTAAERAANPAWDAMFSHPMQIHYASGIKPWKYPSSPMSDLWYDELTDSGLMPAWRAWIDDIMHASERKSKRRHLFSLSFPLGRRRRFVLEAIKETFFA